MALQITPDLIWSTLPSEWKSMDWINMMRGFVNQFKVAQSMRHNWSSTWRRESKITAPEAQALLKQMKWLRHFLTIRLILARLIRNDWVHNQGKRFGTWFDVWNSYKVETTLNVSHVELFPVYHQNWYQTRKFSLEYADDIVNGANPKGPVGTIKVAVICL